MHTTFKMKDLGPLHYFLEMEVSRTSSGLFLHQSKCARDLLQKAGLEKCTSQPTPMAVSSSTDGADTPFADITHFRSLIGALQYLSITRPTSSLLSTELLSACINQVNMITIV